MNQPGTISGTGSTVGGLWHYLRRFGVPAAPTIALTGATVTPPPPRLAATDSEVTRIRTLASAYREAVAARWPSSKLVHAFRGGVALCVEKGCKDKCCKHERSEHAQLLSVAAEVLVEREIRPLEWVAWSLDLWAETRRTAPPVGWVYAADRLAKHVGWFTGTATSLGGRVIVPPAARELARRHTSLRAAIRRALAQGTPLQQLPAIVEQHFPGGLYDVLVEQATHQAQDEQRRLDRAAAEGRWVW